MRIFFINNLRYTFGITLKPSGIIKVTYYNIYTYQQIIEMGYSDRINKVDGKNDTLYYSGLRSSHLSYNSILPYLDFSSDYESIFKSNYIPLELWKNYSEIIFYPISSSWCILPLNYTDKKELTFVGDYYYYYNTNANIIQIKCSIYDDDEILFFSIKAIYDNNSTFHCEIPSLEISNYTVKLFYYDYISKSYQYSGLEYDINLEIEETENFCDECGIYKGNNSCYGCNHILYNYECEDTCNEDEIHLHNIYSDLNCCKYSDLDCYGDCGGEYVIVDRNKTSQLVPCCHKNNFDCDGYCNGGAIEKCGECIGGKTGRNSSEDCNGDCHGKAFRNDCGICVGGNTSYPIDQGKDCNGDCQGDAYIGYCGYCVSGKTGLKPTHGLSCNNICNDTSFINKCGVCVWGSTGLDNDTGIDCLGDCFGGFYNCRNFTIDFDNEELDNIELYQPEDFDIYVNATNNVGKNISFITVVKMYDFYPDLDLYYYSYSKEEWKTPDRELETFKPNDTIQLHLHFYIDIMYKTKRNYRSNSFNSLVLYFNVEKSGVLVEQYLNYTIDYIPCDKLKEIYQCNNMPGCFFCLESMGYNTIPKRDSLEVTGRCIRGDTTNQCYVNIKSDYSYSVSISFLLLFIINLLCI